MPYFRVGEDTTRQIYADIEYQQKFATAEGMVGGKIARFWKRTQCRLCKHSDQKVVSRYILVGDRLAVECDGDVGGEIRTPDRGEGGRWAGQERGKDDP